jgi:hypothetical protein
MSAKRDVLKMTSLNWGGVNVPLVVLTWFMMHRSLVIHCLPDGYRSDVSVSVKTLLWQGFAPL